ncbi:MAG: SDR family oxidoreductase [Deltaproteobacteria bacterium]
MNVLIATPAGYVGRRLLHRLRQDDQFHLRVLVRDARLIREELNSETEVVEADQLDRAALGRAVRGIDVAYFPLRFVSGERDFGSRSRDFASLFRDSCIEAGVKRIISLGVRPAWGNSARMDFLLPEAGEILSACPDRIQTICLFPGIILGPGSVFYEMVMSMVEKLPLLLLPPWTEAGIYPVAISDLVEYLAQAAILDGSGNLAIGIGEGGITLADLFRLAARIRGRRRAMVRVPVMAPRLFAFFLALLTPLSYPLGRALVQLLREVRQGPRGPVLDSAGRYFPSVIPVSAEEALREALAVTNMGAVGGRWTDSLADVDYHEAKSAMLGARYRDERRQDMGGLSPSQVFRSVLALGGEEGWFKFDVLWRMRGFLDKLLGGFGTSLGRRSPTDLRIGDMLDVWRVVDLVENERLLLAAQMKVFGEAWLEFRLQGTTLIQTAYYHPDGALGTLYWYAMLPFHAFIFPDMARNIVKRAREY